jgi:two-component system phosphate regulon response regulator PhoB
MKQINSAQPNLILLDWMLPVISGIELLRRLRANMRTSAIAAIMLSARINDQDRKFGLDSGADDCIKKPFSPRELIARRRAKLRHFMPNMSELKKRAVGLVLTTLLQRINANGLAVELSAIECKMP